LHEEIAMLTKTRFETLFIAAVIAALSAPLSRPAAASEQVYRPIQAITTTVGSKLVAGYFVNKDGRCQVTVMVQESWDPNQDTPNFTAARLRFDLEPNQTASVDSAESASISLTCGEEAETLALAPSPTNYAYMGR
jgi:hypothetical protein